MSRAAAFLEGLDVLEGDELNDRANEALQYVHHRLEELGIENGADVTTRIHVRAVLAFVAETEKLGTVADRLAGAEARLARIERREIDQAVALSKAFSAAGSFASNLGGWLEQNMGDLVDGLFTGSTDVLKTAPAPAWREVMGEEPDPEMQLAEELGAAPRVVGAKR